MSPIQNGNIEPMAQSTPDFYVPDSRELGTIPSTDTIGEPVSVHDFVSTTGSVAINADNSNESAIPQSALGHEDKKVTGNFSSILEHINTPADIKKLAEDMGNRLDHLRVNVVVKR